ncbi:MAG: wax ester/triacylglycerol synthase family O-acyltransferase [Acidimicrobiales bacterium mtb01]|nr:wax ester/triacylglycerol synthase family O-acyltransferase [Actinomycetota bacterium]TEX45368.1 MAG: wax ester/triacylglycerol synthase family O-acyltransferase [Acidimicrobiales bacterium mtb01]
MRQLSGLDATFLHLETSTTFGHVSGLSLYSRPSPEFDPYEVVYRRFEAVAGRADPLHKKLRDVPFGLDHPYWVSDDDFDLDYHVRHLGLAPPGDDRQLADQVARIFGRPLDRSRPLWEVYVIEGLQNGGWALMTKFHHSTIDGGAGVVLLNMLTDATPDAQPDLTPVPIVPDEPVTDAELLQRAVAKLASNPVKALRFQLRVAQGVLDSLGFDPASTITRRARATLRAVTRRPDPEQPQAEDRVRLPLTPAPPTPWNKTITAHRRFAMRSASLETLKALKNASGGTVNDVVMAICTGALRNYLIQHDALPDRPLRAMVPVSLRTGEEEVPWTNMVSGIIADLPTTTADPIERIAQCHEAMEAAKRQFDLLPADTIAEGTQTTSPILATAAARLASRLRWADRANLLPNNVVISNVPGPRQPMYLSGARLENYIPVSIVTDGMGLNITVHSYLDRLDFGLIACRELVPDLWDLLDLHFDEMKTLCEAYGVKPA